MKLLRDLVLLRRSLRNNFTLFIRAIFITLALIVNVGAEPIKAPNFSLNDLNGKNFTLSDHKGSKKILLFFWASWCPHCQEAIKELSRKKGDYNLVTVNIGETRDTISRFMMRRSYNFSVLLDKDSRVSFAYGVLGVPMFIVIEPDLTVTYKDYIFPPDLK